MASIIKMPKLVFYCVPLECSFSAVCQELLSFIADKTVWQWPTTPFMMNSSALKKGLTTVCIYSSLQADNMPSAPLVLIMFPLESESVADCSNKIVSQSLDKAWTTVYTVCDNVLDFLSSTLFFQRPSSEGSLNLSIFLL